MTDAAIHTLSESNGAENYRELSKAAVASVVFAVLGFLGLWAPVFLIMPLLGVFFGAVALATISRYPEEVAGRPAAMVGMIACFALTVGGIAYHSFIYATEVPEGHLRISFADLKPNTRTSIPYSEKAEQFDGQKIFVKGYVRPSKRKNNLKEFILVGDLGACCFGGSPKITDVVAVHIVSDMTTNYSWQVRRIVGTFRLNRTPLSFGDAEVPQVFYTIEADEVR